MRLSDFQILQRDDDGYARFVYEGVVPDTYIRWDDEVIPILADAPVFVRVVLEDENLILIPWTRCERKGADWSVSLTVPEGGLYRFEATIFYQGGGARVDIFHIVYHVGVGDIYVTAGQSNMAGYASDSAHDPATLGVHVLTNRGIWSIASHPLHNGVDSIFGQPETACGVSPALSFARRLKEKLGIPIGILPAAVGGSGLDNWIAEKDGKCFIGMEKRIRCAGGRFKGYLWMQGCYDANIPACAATYYERFQTMLDGWRKAFGEHPVLTVQLNRFAGGSMAFNSTPPPPPPEKNKGWGLVRDAQRRAALEIPDVYVVPSLDLAVCDGIHNNATSQVIIGERLANTALSALYGKLGQLAPLPYGAELREDGLVFLRIQNAVRMAVMDNRAAGFQAEDEQGLTDFCTGVGWEGGLLLKPARPITLPAQLHYAWGMSPPLFAARDQNDMPLPAFYGIKIEQADNC